MAVNNTTSKSKAALSSSLSFSVDEDYEDYSHLYDDEDKEQEEEGGDDEGSGRAHSAPVFSAGELGVLPSSIETTLARDKQVRLLENMDIQDTHMVTPTHPNIPNT